MTPNSETKVQLRPMTAATAEAIVAGRPPEDIRVPSDHPTEFSQGVASSVLGDGAGPCGPFCIHQAQDGLVVGEIGGNLVSPGTVEIGYAIVPSLWGRGFATAAVRALLPIVWASEDVQRVIAHTPLDRPASGRVLEKVGFRMVGQVEDEHEGVRVQVLRWELLRPAGG